MIVVSDTSPVRALVSIGCLDLLHALFENVVVPPAVARELSVRHELLAPFSVGDCAWMRLRAPADVDRVNQLRQSLDAGESEAIALAIEIGADAVLIDERVGRRIAMNAGLQVIGVVGILVSARQRGLVVRVAPLLDELERSIRFRMSQELRERALRDAGEWPQ